MNALEVTDADIRRYLGHNGVECKVRIKRNGDVCRYGSPEPTDRSLDFWVWIGKRHAIVREIQAGNMTWLPYPR